MASAAKPKSDEKKPRTFASTSSRPTLVDDILMSDTESEPDDGDSVPWQGFDLGKLKSKVLKHLRGPEADGVISLEDFLTDNGNGSLSQYFFAALALAQEDNVNIFHNSGDGKKPEEWADVKVTLPNKTAEDVAQRASQANGEVQKDEAASGYEAESEESEDKYE